MLKPEPNQLDEFKMQKLNDSEMESFDDHHSVLSNNSNISGLPTSGASPSPGAVMAATATGKQANPNRRLRHQGFSKNIYIGTKNAERWDLVRSGLKFKNDVEFVSFLLRLAESGHGATFLEETKHIDEENSENEKPSVLHNKNNAKTENGEKETNNNVGAKTKKRNQNNRRNKISHKHNNNNSSSSNNNNNSSNGNSIISGVNATTNNNENVQPTMNPLSEKPAKVAKKVKFHDDVKIIERIDDDDGEESCGEEQYQQALGAGNGPTTSMQFPLEAQDHSISSTIDGSITEDSNSVGVLDCRIEEKIKIELEEKKKLERQSIYEEQLPSTSSLTDVKLQPPATPKPPRMMDFDDDDDDDGDLDNNEEKFTVPNPEIDPSLFAMDCESLIKVARIPDPNAKIKVDPSEVCVESVPPAMNPVNVPKKKKTINRKRQCCSCNTKHGKDQCPLRTPVGELSDKITLDEWLENAKKLAAEYLERQKLLLAKSPLDFNDDDADGENGEMTVEMKQQAKERETFEETKNFLSKLPSYSELSLPEKFEFQPSNHPMHGQSVFAKTPIPKFTKLGPVIGNQVTETDINDDCTMRFVFEIFDGTKSTYFSVENKNQSNWLRYIRPARVRDEKNVSLCSFDEEIFFVTCRDLEVGSELLYWSDEHNSSWDKKKMDKASKTNCGGCNLKFDHPLYYRTHCSVFHDSAFSLTIRKYHCKICGISVLGKDSIMKHAEQMHDGKGAYQCQFCKKFFLRLNYLEMHRTYGCSANPQRARPLCDFCGRKFCQPQKLKVHIKRMHSDMAEVLRDFQCKLCSKLLGSRAALQRHSKEVHSRNSAVVSCPRCQKLFQNRSNLKIHMLTHSGVRPFKCAENECTAAFTTKQCLQFHYKKVHGYTQDRMPKIERSVAYTFDAYAGGDPIDEEDETKGSGSGIKRLRTGKSHRESISKILKSDYFFKKQFKDNIFKNKEIISAFSSNSASCDSDNVAMALLSNKISSIINSQQDLSNCSTQNDFDMEDEDDDDGGQDDDEDEMGGSHGGHFPMTESTTDCECGVMEGGELSDKCFKHNGAALKALMAGAHISNNEEFINRDNIFSRHSTNSTSISNQSDANLMMSASESMGDGPISANRSLKELILASNTNLLISKGSKKLMNDESDQHQSTASAGDDCLSNFLSNVAREASDKSSNAGDSIHVKNRPDIEDEIDEEDDEEEEEQQQRTNNDTLLDVAGNGAQKLEDDQQQQHRTSFNESMDHMAQLQQHFPNQMTNSFASSFNQNLLGNYYNNCPSTNNRLSSTSALSTSASLLVEAALNSVSNMIDNEDMANGSDPQQQHQQQQQQNQNQQQQNNESPPSMDLNMANAGHQAQTMNMEMVENFSDDNHDSNIDGNEKMMKSQGYPMHSPFIDSFANTMASNPMSQQHETNNEIDVDSATPKHLDSGGRQDKMNGYGANGGHIYASYDNSHQPSPVPPPPMTPDYTADYCNPASQQHQMRQNSGTPMSTISRKHKIYSEHDMNSPASTVSPLPSYGRDKNMEQQIGASYGGSCEAKDSAMQQQQQQQQQRRQHISSDEEGSVVIPENLSVEHSGGNSQMIEDTSEDDKLKMSQQMDFLYGAKYDNGSLNHRMADLPDLRLKYNGQPNLDALADYRQSNNHSSNGLDEMVVGANGSGASDFQGIDMTSRSGIAGYHHNIHAPSVAGNFNRYHHHIFDILGDRETDQHQQQQHEHHGYSLPPPPPPSVAPSTPQHHPHMQHMQHLIDDHLEPANHQSSVDLSRTSSYLMASPPPSGTASSSISYSHSHSDMLRMVSLDLSSSSSGGMSGAAATHVRHHSSYISSHLPQTSRDALSDHQQRLLSAEQLTTNHRLLLDPAHLLLEQNNRLLSGENSRLLDQSRLMDNNHRHMSAASHRGFYHHHHHHHQITSNYHHSKQLGSAASQIGQHNYHSFPSYY